MNLAAAHAAHPARPAFSLRYLGRRLSEFCLHRILHRVDARLCPPGQLPTHGIHRVLVLRPNHRLGNAILVSPLLDEIEATWPGAEIDLVSAGEAAKTLYSARFQIRRVTCLPRRIVRHPLAAFACLRELRATRYDLAIDPCVASNTGHFLLGACKARYKVGFTSSLAFDALREHDAGLPDHLGKRGVHALRTALGDAKRASWPALDVRLTPNELQQGRHALERILGHATDAHDRRPVLGVFANATGNKRLPEAWWGALATHLQAARPDVRIVEVLAEHGRSQLPGATASFYTRDLRKLAAVLANLHGFVSADCGVMHLAAAVDTPTLGLFVRGNRIKYAPYGDRNNGLDVAMDNADGDGAGAAHMSVMAWVRQAIVPGAGTDTREFPAHPLVADGRHASRENV